MVSEKKCQENLVEGDSKLVIDAITGSCIVPWHLMSVIDDIKDIAKYFEYIFWTHMYRELNFLSDTITKVEFHYIFDCMRTGCNRGHYLIYVFYFLFFA